MAKSVYIHIPFCVRICTYCDFNKFYIANQPVDEYLDCLIKEMSTRKDKEVETVFVGGGTPTALSEAQLERLLQAINDLFVITKEYTFEANPDELTEAKIKLLKQYGVNRLSLGVQTFDDELLKVLGRTHHSDDIEKAVTLSRKHKIPSVSLDLMFHLPGQTLEQFDDSLNKALSLDVDHISSYALILEPKTQFYNLYRKGRLKLPNEDLGEEMYQHLKKKLADSNLNQYEISNFSKEGHESLHNKVYWKNEEYYGFGAGAHGYINGVRYGNINPVNQYIKKLKNGEMPVLQSTEVSLKEQMEEEMFLGLRMTKGVSKTKFQNKFDQSIEDVFGQHVKELIEQELLLDDQDYLRLSNRGQIIGNEVFEKFLLS
ncbi:MULTISPECIES: radical SAM family heme chaperone HemW [Mammaliicoccus]|uniref:Heme chaperone HemW n=1 Tax=Mammaliicoccus sciuri TaxID=1296 RepID=A0AAW5LMN2_MAMSC|nr:MULTISPECIES: radical SAM family heme chaperone HemW [Mammaliicoccus]KTT83539.1 coproporphyrinogen III oxidase [Mammaliicoccus sciuri]MBF0719467.1 oxygen-independent coproporphyrinogen III oxidase [Mammaliicoccus sciuri]MBG9205010.1 oxygen-independent coproporphyrinogen III oxidase [Mammaliicoccus sciuri]MBG9210247.1 oxygen-independent coproporphyrinogen III oxidase [Mammaliicoccus sciuri]MBO1208370.1 oxygen-independent coproporphyrinogen III oxidase [Mammaliicoccus sciuri]